METLTALKFAILITSMEDAANQIVLASKRASLTKHISTKESKNSIDAKTLAALFTPAATAMCPATSDVTTETEREAMDAQCTANTLSQGGTVLMTARLASETLVEMGSWRPERCVTTKIIEMATIVLMTA